MYLDMLLNDFLRSLVQCAADPSPTMQLHLQHRVMVLKSALRQEEKAMEKRITENVLKTLSVRLENNGAIHEIESLRKAIEQLEK